MKRSVFVLLIAGLIALPTMVRAQSYDYVSDSFYPYEYRDVDDGQPLKLLAYVLTPIGMGLEWGLMRPLHYAATQTVFGPILSGDKDAYEFGQNHNADMVPPGTFDPAPMNLSNDYVRSAPEKSSASRRLRESAIPPSRTTEQPVLH